MTAKAKIPKNPYGRLLSTEETAKVFQEMGYDEVTESRLRIWRMDKEHALHYYKKSESRQSHCYYKWEDIHEFKSLLQNGAAFI